MKKLLYLLSLLFFFGLSGFSPIAQEITYEYVAPQSTTVYVTKTGKRYHKSSCRYLSQSKIKTTKSKAINAGYTPCKVCKP